MFEYIALIYAISISFLISVILFFVIYYIVYHKIEIEKSSSYECGFHSFDDSRYEFNVRFYLVSILFIIFDLEIVFLFPWVLSLKFLSTSSFFLVIFFLLILTIGFIYEWLKDALTWE